MTDKLSVVLSVIQLVTQVALVEQMTLQKGSKNGDALHGGITRQNWYHFVQNCLKFMKLDM